MDYWGFTGGILMTDFQYDEEPVHIVKDNGFNKRELISPENRRKSRERMNDPNYVSEAYLLKELFGEIGIVVIPERMTKWYAYTK